MPETTSVQTRRTEAYSLYEELKTKLAQHGYVFLKIGQLLKKIRDEELYKYIGEGGNETFQQFLAAPEIALKRPTAYLYIRVYEFYIEKIGLTEEQVVAIPEYKLFRLLPLLRNKTKAEIIEVLDKVSALGTMDTEKVIEEQHLDPWKRPRVYRCEKCGRWKVDYFVKSICDDDGIFKLTAQTEENV